MRKKSAKTYVLYHGNCYDGFGAAWAAFHALGAAGVRYLPVTHGRPVPELEEGAAVYLLDFSYPRDTLLEIADQADSLTIIDHHATAREALHEISMERPNIRVMFDMEHSGAILTWKFFYPKDEPPLLLWYIEDRDLWKFSMHGSKEVAAALRTYPMVFDVWSTLGTDELERDGEAVLRHEKMMTQMICSQAAVGRVGGELCVVVNATAFWSEVGHKLLEDWTEAPFSASWYIDKWGDKIWSLRGRKDGYDVGALAKRLGGGGHYSAAGFTERGTNKGPR